MTPAELEALRNRATRPRRTVPIILDGDVRQRVEELLAEREALADKPDEDAKDRRLASRRRADTARLAEIDALLDVEYATVESSTLQVVVEGLGGTDWQAFRSTHQPQREGNRADQVWGFNTEAGREPLIRATVIGHRDGETLHPVDAGTLDWLVGFCTDWQLDLLFLAGLTTSRGDDAVPLRPAPSTTPVSDGA